ncbi:MAG: hypothetical protein IIZ66_00440 [Clostridia bacterium]|nr:hypothetical protein [Clostridia bacterium]
MSGQIVNIINFIRACEPRDASLDLLEPVVKQAELMKKYGLRGTFLLQYDALTDPEFTDFLKTLDPGAFELGVWYEVVEPLCDAVGEPWKGRFPWDWHAHCDLPQGYAPEVRLRLTDELFERFRAVFGYFPRVMGAWVLDTVCINHAHEKYGLDALCCCKEQYGTDGYTLWGGYYGQGYYPSKKNFFIPAQTAENQLSVPVFRMLGSDPVYQYDLGLSVDGGAPERQGVITLEPASGTGGRSREWVDWYLEENFNGECLSFGYTQAGQENSFGWEGMAEGLDYQFSRFRELAEAGRLKVLTLGETGRFYKDNYAVTPASAICAHTAYDDAKKSSVWYCSRFYRVNIFSDENGVRVRDEHTFDENDADRYLAGTCAGETIAYTARRVIDGNIQSGGGVLAGIYPYNKRTGGLFYADGFVFKQTGAETCEVAFGGLIFTLAPEGYTVAHPDGVEMRTVKKAP